MLIIVIARAHDIKKYNVYHEQKYKNNNKENEAKLVTENFKSDHASIEKPMSSQKGRAAPPTTA